MPTSSDCREWTEQDDVDTANEDSVLAAWAATDEGDYIRLDDDRAAGALFGTALAVAHRSPEVTISRRKEWAP